eukprot:CAMPEP_0170602960 /NCGR_PEP_ID=MMETSP0224-20130122/18667_1 /TAXON_ID=285029 /ORGANISM="Togula jolla, Strain CCCM 725" /LENGTH=65 /DNA_ID=CAMNT_0010927829 /DNA_START=820 /DNA_END=1017 /DNA_ORIENTATION=-
MRKTTEHKVGTRAVTWRVTISERDRIVVNAKKNEVKVPTNTANPTATKQIEGGSSLARWIHVASS